MEILRVEIPQHIRKVQFSAKQRPVYFEWNGVSIKGKRVKIHKRYFKDKQHTREIIKIEDLQDRFFIGRYRNNKLEGVSRDSAELPSVNELIRTKDKYRLTILTKEMGAAEIYLPVICNPKVVNTPKMMLIKGQDFYSQKVREHQRALIMGAIKECYKPHLLNLPVINEYPVRIECEIHDTIRNVYDKKEGLGLPWDLDNYAYPYMKAFPDIMQALGKLRNDDRLHVTAPPAPMFVPIENHDNRKLVFIISKDERDVIVNNEIYKEFHSSANHYDFPKLNPEVKDIF